MSYAREDIDFAQKLCESLQIGYGVSIWVDFQNIRGGMDWIDNVDAALDRCTDMLLLVSPASMDSRHVANEWKYFYENGKRIIPILLSPSRRPFGISSLHYYDFSGQDYETSLEQLTSALFGLGIKFNEFTNPIINSNKTGNLFWLSHDLIELYRWLLTPSISKQWLDIGMRQSHHHMVQLGIDKLVLSELTQLLQETANLQENQWTVDRRRSVADKVKELFNTVAQIAQKADPDFDSGPG